MQIQLCNLFRIYFLILSKSRQKAEKEWALYHLLIVSESEKQFSFSPPLSNQQPDFQNLLQGFVSDFHLYIPSATWAILWGLFQLYSSTFLKQQCSTFYATEERLGTNFRTIYSGNVDKGQDEEPRKKWIIKKLALLLSSICSEKHC